MPQIFISYRRQDSAPWAGKLFDALASRYGVDKVFIDLATITAGADFAAHVEAAVRASDVVLVLIGPDWAEAAYRSDGRRRIDDPSDLVRREIQTALSQDKRVIPILVGDAAFPDIRSLPAEIATLASLQACRLADSTWNHDVAELTSALDTKTPSFFARLFR